MLKFFRRYQLQWKALASAVFLFGAIDHFFLRDDLLKRNWNLFAGIVFLILGIISIVDAIELIRKRKIQKNSE